MARPEKLIEPINNAKFDDVARSLLQPKSQPEETPKSAPENKDTSSNTSTNQDNKS